MVTLIGALRRRLLTPSEASVELAARGFPVGPALPGNVIRLERIPKAVVRGFRAAVDGCATDELAGRLASVEDDLRGFAYEGAAMASVVLDAMALRPGRTRRLVLGPGRPHLLMAYIGIGFALARLPRAVWARAIPDLDGAPHHPTMSWLVIDGYAFDLAYFDAARWIVGQERPAAYPWQGDPEYFARAADQGIGRALWFYHAANPFAVADEVARFAADRRRDLWSGVGLAATFAGGAPVAALAALRDVAGESAVELGVGAVFAATARTAAGAVTDATHTAVAELCGLTVEQAVALADRTAPDADTGAIPSAVGMPEYERWRVRIRTGLAATGQVAA